MSVIVKGIQMPLTCSECQLAYDFMACCVTGNQWFDQDNIDAGFDPNKARLPDCPLKEITGKHGDLIDRTALLKEFELAQKSADMHGREYANAFYSSGGEISSEWWAVEELVENAIAVIEAEGEG